MRVVSIEDLRTLPRLEIIIDEYYLWSPDSGLYLVGDNFPNWAQSWEYPGAIRLIENNDTLFQEDVN